MSGDNSLRGLEGEITVLGHALAAFTDRWPEVTAGLSPAEVRREIAVRVRVGCNNGQVYDKKPKAFVAKGERRGSAFIGQRFVLYDRDSLFVVSIGMLPNLTVITCLRRLPRW